MIKENMIRGLEEAKEILSSFQEFSQQFLQKHPEDVKQDDIIFYNSMLHKLDSLNNFFTSKKEANIQKLNDVNEKQQKFPLIDRKDIITPEEEQNLNEENLVISEFESIRDNFEILKQEMSSLIKNGQDKINQAEEEDRKRRIQVKQEEVEKFIRAPGNVDAVWMEVESDSRIPCRFPNGGRPVSKKIEELMTVYHTLEEPHVSQYIPFGVLGRDGDDVYKNINFTGYDDCRLEQKQQLMEYQQKVATILKDESDVYDKPGQIVIPIYEDEKGYLKNAQVTIDITPRQLAQAGIFYEDLDWKSLEQIKAEQKAKVTPSDIAKVDTESMLTRNEVGGIKGLFNRLIGKFKNNSRE